MLQSSNNAVIWIIAVISWIIILGGIGMIAKFYASFCIARKTLEANILSLNGQVKRLQSTITELLVEQRKTNRAQQVMLDLKQAEMTGDFEIIEEPIEMPGEEEEEETPPMSAAPSTFPQL